MSVFSDRAENMSLMSLPLLSSSTEPKGQRSPTRRSMASPQRATAWAASAHTPTTTSGWRRSIPLARAPPARWWRPARPSRPRPRLLARSGQSNFTKCFFLIRSVILTDITVGYEQTPRILTRVAPGHFIPQAAPLKFLLFLPCRSEVAC